MVKKVSFRCFHFSLYPDCLLWMISRLNWPLTIQYKDCDFLNWGSCTLYFRLHPACIRQQEWEMLLNREV